MYTPLPALYVGRSPFHCIMTCALGLQIFYIAFGTLDCHPWGETTWFLLLVSVPWVVQIRHTVCGSNQWAMGLNTGDFNFFFEEKGVSNKSSALTFSVTISISKTVTKCFPFCYCFYFLSLFIWHTCIMLPCNSTTGLLNYKFWYNAYINLLINQGSYHKFDDILSVSKNTKTIEKHVL